MLEEHFGESPFHQALHYWARASRDQPLLHVDIHGKTDREKDCDIDVGIKCMEVHWKGDNLIKEIRQFFDYFGNIFADVIIKGHQCRFNAHPARLSGYWGGREHTMTEQAIMLGIPSFQLEIPYSVRRRMLVDDDLRVRFHNFFKGLYYAVIVPDQYDKKRHFKTKKEIRKSFVIPEEMKHPKYGL